MIDYKNDGFKNRGLDLDITNKCYFFDIYMEGLQPERFYKIMFKIDNNQVIDVFDNDYIFKVIR